MWGGRWRSRRSNRQDRRPACPSFQLPPRGVLPIGRKAIAHVAREQAAVSELGDRPVVHVLAGQDPGQHEIERRRLGEHPARRHPEDELALPEGEPEEAAGVGGRAVTLHASAQQREPAEHGVERIERTRPRDDQDLGARPSERRELVGDHARRATREPYGQEAAAEPFGLLLERSLEARPLPGVEALLGDSAERRRTEAAHGDEPARGARRRLDGANRALGDDQRRDLAFGDGLARLHWLPGEKGEDRHPLEHVHVPQRTPTDLEEPAAGRGERPLPAAVAFHLHAIADDRRRQPSPGVLLVEVTGLYREDVDLVPGRREQRCGGRRREARALLNGDLARRVAHVVAEHAVDEALERRRLPSLCDRLHAFRGLAESGWPLPPPRAAWISAMIARAISGAERAPRSRPIGTRTRLSWASLTPSSVRNVRIAAPRRDDPSIPI